MASRGVATIKIELPNADIRGLPLFESDAATLMLESISPRFVHLSQSHGARIIAAELLRRIDVTSEQYRCEETTKLRKGGQSEKRKAQ